ncbi:hypothetical protein OSB04_018376 [Centaurea solstitialis]|uniref:RNA-directed DNA polymerase n=1 Tax=Centaurea solstitialis TaxID=347529 RepID=A0AA38WMX5_9ASTR|nr:hypothetical protein OSB04_018376 [Centaurea solstitialis]
MEKYEEASRRLDGHDEALKQIQVSIEELKVQNAELSQGIKILLAAQGKKITSEPDPSSDFVNDMEGDDEGDSSKTKNKQGYQLVNRMTKLEFPSFDGEAFKDWYYKCNQFFELDNTPENMKIRLVSIHLKGRALQWHQGFMSEMEGKTLDWEKYLAELRDQFVEGIVSKPLIELRNLKLTTTVSEYNSKFNALRNQVAVPPDILLDLYIGGLTNEIMHTVQLMDPKTLNQAMKLARIQEGAYYALWGLEPPKPPEPPINNFLDPSNFIQNSRTSTTTNSPAPTSLPSPKFLPSPLLSQSSSFTSDYRKPPSFQPARRSFSKPVYSSSSNQSAHNKNPIKQLTKKEYDEKRRNNQCFFCNERYVPGHKCKNSKLYMLLCPDVPEEMVENGGLDGLEGIEGFENPNPDGESDATMSIHALLGSSGMQTLQVKGMIKKQEVNMLVDSGSTNNFIDLMLAKKLGIKLTPIRTRKVSVADGFVLSVHFMCKSIRWSIQGVPFVDNFLVIPLGGYGAVLGIQWLSSLGDIKCNFQQLVMEFTWLGKWVKLKGTSNDRKSQSVMGRGSTKWHEEQAYLLESAERCAQLWSIDVSSDRTSNLDSSKKEELSRLLKEFEEVFNLPKKLPPKRSHDHSITLKQGSNPVNLRAYRYGALHKNIIEELVQDMLHSGVIRPSHSEFASPVVLVKKKDGSWRFCVDYRKLNQLTVKDQFPIPIVEELIDELHGSRYFSKLDLRSGYHQIRMRETDIGKTAFRTHEGLYEFVVMPFGLSNAPATFQGLMNSIFRPYLRKFVLVFFDDILVYSQTWEKHVSHLRLVLQTLRQQSLYAKASKCTFGSGQVNYLGHVINGEGVTADPKKVEDMISWPKPTSLKELRGFLGLTGYYRRFVKDYGKIAKPLTDLLKKGAFGWNSQAEHAFSELKRSLTQTPVLALPNFSEPFTIETDASGAGVGAVLTQNKHPIAYFSKALGPRHMQLATYERELLAIVAAIDRWRGYVMGRPFVIKTDHQALKHILDQKECNPTLQKWLNKLIGLEYTVIYQKGSENLVADALSRRPHENSLSSCLAISSVFTSLPEKIRESVIADGKLQGLIDVLKNDPAYSGKFSLENGYLLRKGRMVVGDNDDLRRELIEFFHASALGGHSGVHATNQRLARSVYWKGMQAQVRNFVRSCHVCQQSKYETAASPGLLQPIEIPDRFWSVVSMDFVEGLPKSGGYTTILVVVDKLSKFAHFLALKHPYTAATISQLFLDNVTKLYGMPDKIISDRDPLFLSNFWKELFRVHKTKLAHSTAYHPQSDGQTEVLNRCLETYLRCFTLEAPTTWAKWLPLAQLWYNTSHHSSLKMSPYQALFGQAPPDYIHYHPKDSSNQAVDSVLREREVAVQLLKSNLGKAQERMKAQADKHRSEKYYEVGDWVYLKLQPYRQHSVNRRAFHKLAAKYYGPYEITKKVGTVAYQLKLPPETRIHNVFHVSLLKKRLGDHSVSSVLPPVSDAGEFHLIPLKVIDKRMVKKKNRLSSEVLVQWSNTQVEDSTWKMFLTYKRDSLVLTFGVLTILEVKDSFQRRELNGSLIVIHADYKGSSNWGDEYLTYRIKRRGLIQSELLWIWLIGTSFVQERFWLKGDMCKGFMVGLYGIDFKSTYCLDWAINERDKQIVEWGLIYLKGCYKEMDHRVWVFEDAELIIFEACLHNIAMGGHMQISHLRIIPEQGSSEGESKVRRRLRVERNRRRRVVVGRETGWEGGKGKSLDFLIHWLVSSSHMVKVRSLTPAGVHCGGFPERVSGSNPNRRLEAL